MKEPPICPREAMAAIARRPSSLRAISPGPNALFRQIGGSGCPPGPVLLQSCVPANQERTPLARILPPLDEPRREGDLDAVTVLLAEDDPDVSRSLEINLVFEGFDVTAVSDGRLALDVASQLVPDIAILDIVLPRLDGIEVCRELRRAPRTRNSAVIMVTARTLAADRLTALQAGADDYIMKPFDPRELATRVHATHRS